VNDAVEALQAKVGADSSAVTSSLDYKVAQLEALGTATAFTPSWNNFTVGNAVESWYYTQVNDLVVVHGITTLGSTSAVTGAWSMNYPVGSPPVTGSLGGTLLLVDDTGDNVVGLTLIGSSTTSFRYLRAPGTDVIYATVNATSPFTWTTDDQIRAFFVYQLS
jgi:hypothetical protein